MTLNSANIQFNKDGNPVASDFDDVYFSQVSGLLETEYVFVENNHLLQRWQSFHQPHFVIAETGFGTGLNALVTFEKFSRFRQQNPNAVLKTLYFISTEKFPLSQQDLHQALLQWPTLSTFIEPLLQQYPVAVEGCHRMIFADGAIVLDLWLGDLQHSLPKWQSQTSGRVDAWYLDGFAPSKNPEMWSNSLFEKMALLANDNCTFATFTAAGFVKRGLMNVGFTVEKRKGFGRKRDMLAGHIKRPQRTSSLRGYFKRNSAEKSTASASNLAIIGSGLAGANTAFALAQKGLSSTIYCKDQQAAQGASGNPQAGFYPQLNAEAGFTSQIQALSFQFAVNRYNTLTKMGYKFDHDWCGVVQLGFNAKVLARQHKLIKNQHWPEALIEAVNQHQVEALAGVPLPYSGLHIPLGGWVNPAQLIEALLKAADKEAGSQLVCNKTLVALERQDEHWRMCWNDGTESCANTVIFATGSDSHYLDFCDQLPTRLVRGQVEAIPTQTPLTALKTVLCHKGYLTPAYNQHHALGSTYIKNDTNTDYRASEQQLNLSMQEKAMSKCDWIEQIEAGSRGRAAIRCGAPDHLPIVGAIPDTDKQKQQYSDLYKALPNHHYEDALDHPNLYILTGLGSRGLTTSALMAELLASQIAGHPLPLAKELLNALNPNRFLIKDLICRRL